MQRALYNVHYYACIPFCSKKNTVELIVYIREFCLSFEEGSLAYDKKKLGGN